MDWREEALKQARNVGGSTDWREEALKQARNVGGSTDWREEALKQARGETAKKSYAQELLESQRAKLIKAGEEAASSVNTGEVSSVQKKQAELYNGVNALANKDKSSNIVQDILVSENPLAGINRAVGQAMNVLRAGAQQRLDEQEAARKKAEEIYSQAVTPEEKYRARMAAVEQSMRRAPTNLTDPLTAMLPEWIPEEDPLERQAMAAEKRYQESNPNLLTDVAKGAVGLVSDAAISGATGVPYLAVMAGQGGAQAAQNALDETGNANKALIAGLGSGAISAGIESAFGIAGKWGTPMLNKIGASKAGQKILSALPKKALDFIASLPQSKLGQIAGNALGEGIEEIAEYDLQRIFENLILDKDTPRDIKEQLYSGLVGAGIGGLFGAGSNIVSNRLARSAENQPVSEANATEEITPVVAETTAEKEIKPAETNLDAKTIEAIEKDEISRNIMVGLYGEEWKNEASETIGQRTLEKAKEMRDMRNSLDEAARRSESTRLVDAMKKRGINVETKAFAGEDSGRVGYYDVANDRIVLNERAKADEVFKFVTAHEISHSVENTDAYSSLRSLAEKSYTPEGLEQAIRKTQEEYRREAGQELDREGALREITADYLGNILKDSKRLEQIVYDDRNLAERLLDAIKKFLSDVSDSFKGIDRSELENAERILERALTEKTGTDSRGRSVETKKASTTGIDDFEAQDVKSKIKKQYSLIRVDSDTAKRLDAFEKRYDSDAIWRSQLAMRDAAGNWVTEIDDSGAKFHRDGKAKYKDNPDVKRLRELYDKLWEAKITNEEFKELSLLEKAVKALPKGNTLEYYLEHPKLYEKYPEARDIKVVFDDSMSQNHNGSYNPVNNTITISTKAKDPMKTIIHEVQHWLQHQEDRHYGADIDTGFLAAVKDALVAMADDKSFKSLSAEKKAERIISYIEGEYKTLDAAARHYYRNASGEVEARATASRLVMGEKARRRYKPKIEGDWVNSKNFDPEFDEAASKAGISESEQDIVVQEIMGRYNDGSKETDRDALEVHSGNGKRRHLADSLRGRDGRQYSLERFDSAEIGETDSAGRRLTEEQQEYFADSKVRDENGKLIPVYHGSGAKFTEFSYDFMSSHGSMEGQGFYFTDNKGMAEGYEKKGGQLLEGYLDIKKPLSDSKITLKRSEVKKLVEAIDPTGDEIISNYGDGVGYPSKVWYNKSLNELLDSVMRYNDSDSEILADLANSGGGSKAVLNAARDVLGYDGYIVEGKYDDATIYVAFASNQFKQKDNAAPTTDPDIRYALTKRDEADIEKIIDELAEEFGIMRPGANRTTDVKTPKATGQGNVRRFAQSVMESQHSDDEIRTLVKEGIIDNVLTYKVEGDQAALDYANNELEKLGYERAMGAWENAISGDKALSKNEIVFGERLLVEAAKNQNYEDVLKLTAQIAVEGTRAGQMVQALSMLKRMGPEGQLVTLQRYVEKTNKDFAQEARKKATRNKGDILRKEQELRKEKEKAKEQENALKKSLEEAKASASEAKQILRKSSAVSKSLEKRIASVQARITELNGKIADSKEVNEELKQQLEELRKERDKAKEQEEALKKSMGEAKKSASEMKKSLSKTLSGNKSLEKRIAKVQERITELEGKIAESKEINEELKEQLAELREERNKLYKLANSYKNKNATKERQIFDKANQILDLEKILTRQVKMYETQKAALENLSMTAKAMKELERSIANLKGEIVISEETVKDIMSQTTQKGLDEAMERAYKEVAAQVPATLLDKWNAWRYMAMLTNPTTHIRNVLGNAAFMPARALKNAAKVYLEKKLDAKEKTAAHLGKDSEDYLKLAGEAFEENKNFLKSGGKYNPSNVIMDNRRIFDIKQLENLRKWNSNMMEKEDTFFLKKAYIEAYARYLKANDYFNSANKEETKRKANEWATREALRATYRDASAFANMLSKYEREHKFGGFIVNAFVPFKKTPINIAKRGYEYSPLGLAKGLWEMKKGVESGTVSAAVALDDLASGLSGTAIMVLGMLLARWGLLTGSGDDDKEKNAYDKAVGGFQPYSLIIGDNTYTLNWAAPTALPMFTGVELHNLTAKEGLSFGEMLGSLFKVLDPMAEMSMLSSLVDIIRSAGYATDSASMISNMAMETVTSYLGQYVPTLGRRIAGIADDTQRNVYYRDETKGMPTSFVIFGNEVKNKIPLISKTIEPKIDVWGRTIQEGTIERFLENTVSPGYRSKKKMTPVDEEIIRVYENTADSSVIPDTSPGRTYSKNGENISMSATEFTTYRQIAGQMQYNNINSLIKTKWYKGLTDEEKAEVIAEMYSYANYFGKKQVFGNNFTSDKYLKKYKASLNSKIPYSDIYRYDKEIDALQESRGDKAAWEVVVSYLDKQPLNKVQKMYLFPLFSTKEKNPYA